MEETPTGEKLGETEALEGQRELGSLVSMGFTKPTQALLSTFKVLPPAQALATGWPARFSCLHAETEGTHRLDL